MKKHIGFPVVAALAAVLPSAVDRTARHSSHPTHRCYTATGHLIQKLEKG